MSQHGYGWRNDKSEKQHQHHNTGTAKKSSRDNVTNDTPSSVKINTKTTACQGGSKDTYANSKKVITASATITKVLSGKIVTCPTNETHPLDIYK